MAGVAKADVDNLGDGLKNVLQAIVACQTVPNAPLQELMQLQIATLGLAKKLTEPQQPQGGGMQPGGGQPGQPGAPGAGPPPGMGPPTAGGGQPNQAQVAPQPGQTPRGMMSGNGINAMSQDPDELRRILQQQTAG